MKIILSAVLLFMSLTAPALAENSIIGSILAAEGDARINGAEATVNMPVHKDDVLSTGPASRLYIMFIDNTEFTLSENARFEVDEYNFNEKKPQTNYATYSVLKGTFLYVSGLLAKTDKPDVKVNIPQGSIGIRGTKFWGGVIDGQYGVIVGEGKIAVSNTAGSVVLMRGQGTVLKDRITKPDAPGKWSADKIARATAAVALQNPAEIGARMFEARKEQEALRAAHIQAQQDVKRADPVLLQKQIEEKMILLNPEVRPDLLEKAEAERKAKELEEKKQLLKERLALKAQAEKAAAATAALKDKTATTTSTTVVKQTSDTATAKGERTLKTTTETVKSVTDKAAGTVKTTAETVKTETVRPAADISETVKNTVKETAAPVEKTIKPVITGTAEKSSETTSDTLTRAKAITSTTAEGAATTIQKVKARSLRGDGTSAE